MKIFEGVKSSTKVNQNEPVGSAWVHRGYLFFFVGQLEIGSDKEAFFRFCFGVR